MKHLILLTWLSPDEARIAFFALQYPPSLTTRRGNYVMVYDFSSDTLSIVATDADISEDHFPFLTYGEDDTDIHWRNNHILHIVSYSNSIGDAHRNGAVINSLIHVYIPTAGVRCLHYLRTVSQSGLLLLTADKSQHTLDKLDGRGAPSLVTHGGSFSLTVNYHGCITISACERTITTWR